MIKTSSKVLFSISGLIFFIGAVFLIWWTASFKSWELKAHLQIISPLFLEIIFVLMVLIIGANVITFKKTFCGIPKNLWHSLSAIIIGGLLITMFVVPREHRIFYDEDIYQNIAQNIAYLKNSDTRYSEEGHLESLSKLWKGFIGRAGMCNDGRIEYGEYNCHRLEYNKEPNGWPYLLSIAFRLFGVHELVSFLTNNLVYVLSILTVFLTGFLLFKDPLSGIYAALIFALIPEIMIWANTAAVEPSASLFSGLAFLSALIFIKNRDVKSFCLTGLVTVFSVQFRPESMMFMLVVGCVLYLYGKEEFKKFEFYLPLSLCFILIIPHLVHLLVVKDMSWGSVEGAKFSMEFFEKNFNTNSLFYIDNIRFPVFFSFLFGLGLILKKERAESGESVFLWKEKSILLIWFLLFWGIFLFFYAGSYNYGTDVRFSLLSYMPIVLIGGNGAASLMHMLSRKYNFKCTNYIAAFLIIFSFISFLPFMRAVTQEAWGARADHRFAEKMVKALPENSIVLTHNPSMFLLWGKSSAQASLATENPDYFNRLYERYKENIYFHYNFWCNVPDPLQKSFCNNILEQFNSTAVVSFEEKNYIYKLYKVGKKEAPLKGHPSRK